MDSQEMKSVLERALEDYMGPNPSFKEGFVSWVWDLREPFLQGDLDPLEGDLEYMLRTCFETPLPIPVLREWLEENMAALKVAVEESLKS